LLTSSLHGIACKQSLHMLRSSVHFVQNDICRRNHSQARLGRSRYKCEPGSAFIEPTCQALEKGFKVKKGRRFCRLGMRLVCRFVAQRLV